MNSQTYYFYKFSTIKWQLIKYFFKAENIVHFDSFEDIKELKFNKNDRFFFWGKKINNEILEFLKINKIQISYVEDGFIRSLGLGSSLSRPLSLVIDNQGIYFDPNQPSDLENILLNKTFTQEDIQYSKNIIKLINELKISKYNHQNPKDIDISKNNSKKIILIPGQVDDDMSVKYGAFGMNNFLLIKEVRKLNPNKFIIFKPHPDVLSGNRNGMLDKKEVLKYADMVVEDVNIDTIIRKVDEVHTMTSLVGFDALVRNKKVFTYGMPFYAGWGLTVDMHKEPRRIKKLSLEELVAGSIIHYPKYLNPYTNQESTPIEIINILAKQKDFFNYNKLYKYMYNFTGAILPKIRNFIKNVRNK